MPRKKAAPGRLSLVLARCSPDEAVFMGRTRKDDRLVREMLSVPTVGRSRLGALLVRLAESRVCLEIRTDLPPRGLPAKSPD